MMCRLNVSQAQLARMLDISPAAVSQWGLREPIPELRQYQLERMYPNLFPVSPPLEAEVA